MSQLRHTFRHFFLAAAGLAGVALPAYGQQCPSVNPQGGTHLTSWGQYEFAYRLTAPAEIAVDGFSFYTRSRTGGSVTLQAHIYRASGSGAPQGSPEAFGTMTVTSAVDWQAATLAHPVEFDAGEHFYVAVQASTAIYKPQITSGSSTPAYFLNGTWRQISGGNRVAIRVRCTSPSRFDLFGTGCLEAGQGSGSWSTPSNNFLGGLLPSSYVTTQRCYQAVASTGMMVTGFAFYNRSRTGGTINVRSRLYLADAAGNPQRIPAATGWMSIGSNRAFHETVLDPPVRVLAGEKFFLALDATTSVILPEIVSGLGAPGWWRSGPAASWTRLSSDPGVSYRTFGTAIGHTDRPRIGHSFAVHLWGARPNTSAFLLIGFDNTMLGGMSLPLDLGFAGASGCSILTSSDISIGIPTNPAGEARIPLSLPNQGYLIGARVYLQWLVVDPGANALNLVVTGGGNALVGN